MTKLTTIPLRPDVRDRLRGFGSHGMNYSDILTAILDRVERDEFLAEVRRRLDDPSIQWVRHEDMEWD